MVGKFWVVPLRLGSTDPHGVPQNGTTLRIDNPENAWVRQARRPCNQDVAVRGHPPCVDHRGFHVVLPSETWCTVMFHLGSIACDLHMMWKTALLFSSSAHLGSFPATYVDFVLALMDVVLDRQVHVSNFCIPLLAFGGRTSPCVTAFSRLLGLALRLSRTCLSMPPGNPRRAGGWHLRRKPCVENFLYVLIFPCILASQFCVFDACTTHTFLL